MRKRSEKILVAIVMAVILLCNANIPTISPGMGEEGTIQRIEATDTGLYEFSEETLQAELSEKEALPVVMVEEEEPLRVAQEGETPSAEGRKGAIVPEQPENPAPENPDEEGKEYLDTAEETEDVQTQAFVDTQVPEKKEASDDNNESDDSNAPEDTQEPASPDEEAEPFLPEEPLWMSLTISVSFLGGSENQGRYELILNGNDAEKEVFTIVNGQEYVLNVPQGASYKLIQKELKQYTPSMKIKYTDKSKAEDVFIENEGRPLKWEGFSVVGEIETIAFENVFIASAQEEPEEESDAKLDEEAQIQSGEKETEKVEDEKSEEKQEEGLDTEQIENNLAEGEPSIGLYSSFTGRKRIKDIFPDGNLAVVAANTLGKAGDTSAYVYQSDFDAYQDTVSAHGITVGNIEGIQYFNNAVAISFENSQNVSDLSPLVGANLKNLKRLYLKNNKVSESLIHLGQAGLTSLQELYLENNGISDVGPLLNLTALRTLSLEDNAVKDLAPLKNLKNLNVLFAKNNGIKTIGPDTFKDFDSLQKLYIENNLLEDEIGLAIGVEDALLALQYAKNLNTLSIINNKIVSINALKNITSLQTLWMAGNRIYDISALNGRNITVYNGTGQTPTFTNKIPYSTLVPFALGNVVVGKDGKLAPITASQPGNGIYREADMMWNELPPGLTEVKYTWSTTQGGLPSPFAGTVTQSVVEIEPIGFTITNQVINNPGNAEMTYQVKMTTAEGVVIAPERQKNTKVTPLSTGSDYGVFTLKQGESIALKGHPGTTYEVIQIPDTTYQYGPSTITYKKEHGTDTQEGEIVANQPVVGTLAEDAPNQLTFTNTYWMTLVVEHKLIGGPVNELEYALLVKDKSTGKPAEVTIILENGDLVNSQANITLDKNKTRTQLIIPPGSYTYSLVTGLDELRQYATAVSAVNSYGNSTTGTTVIDENGFEYIGIIDRLIREGTDTVGFTHRHMINIKVVKKWEGGPGEKPDIYLKLSRSVAESESETLVQAVRVQTAVDESQVIYSFGKYPSTDEEGNLYTYLVEEVDAYGNPLPTRNSKEEGYDKTTIKEIDEATGNNTITITNTYHPRLEDITVNKHWINGESNRPETVTIHLYRTTNDDKTAPESLEEAQGDDSWEAVGTLIIEDTSLEDWEGIWEEQPQTNQQGEDYHYTVVEEMSGDKGLYSTAIVKNNNTSFAVTNTYVPPTGLMKVKKAWENTPGDPDYEVLQIQVQLVRNDNNEAALEADLAGQQGIQILDDQGKAQWENLPLTNNQGIAYMYSVEEIGIKGITPSEAGFEVSYSEGETVEHTTTFTITNINRYVPPTGIVLNNMPYLFLLLVALAGLGTQVFGRKKRHREQ